LVGTDLGLNPKASTYRADDVLADLGELLGTVTLRRRGRRVAPYLYVTHLSTPPAMQRRGLASEVLGRVEKIAIARGLLDVRLDTAVDRPDLIAFYEKRGYVSYGPRNKWQVTNYWSQHYRKLLAATVG
jgi:ribosomal protein S18 acetylase RimI-like enzyme